MPRPQFSLRTMLIAVSCLAVACGLIRMAFAYDQDWLSGMLLALAVVCVGVGVGALFNRKLPGAAIAVMLAAFLLWAAILPYVAFAAGAMYQAIKSLP